MRKPISPSIKADKASLSEILALRKLFLESHNFQIRYDACHRRNWSDSYLFKTRQTIIGYGSVKGLKELQDRDAIFEFFVLPGYEKWSNQCLTELVQATKAKYIETQSNASLLTQLLYESCQNIKATNILFEDHHQTHFKYPDVKFRPNEPSDDNWKKAPSEKGAYVLEKKGQILADGGFLTHYNEPFADLYMEVKSNYRNKGYGTYILQEIKKVCYAHHKKPAARCNIDNQASKATLIKAGLKICGYMLLGKL